jgi:hypothetical protein
MVLIFALPVILSVFSVLVGLALCRRCYRPHTPEERRRAVEEATMELTEAATSSSAAMLMSAGNGGGGGGGSRVRFVL